MCGRGGGCTAIQAPTNIALPTLVCEGGHPNALSPVLQLKYAYTSLYVTQFAFPTVLIAVGSAVWGYGGAYVAQLKLPSSASHTLVCVENDPTNP